MKEIRDNLWRLMKNSTETFWMCSQCLLNTVNIQFGWFHKNNTNESNRKKIEMSQTPFSYALRQFTLRKLKHRSTLYPPFWNNIFQLCRFYSFFFSPPRHWTAVHCHEHKLSESLLAKTQKNNVLQFTWLRDLMPSSCANIHCGGESVIKRWLCRWTDRE